MVWDRKLMQKKPKWPCTIQERSGKDDIPILQSHYIAIFSSIQLKRKLLRTPLCWATFSISYWSQTKHLLLLHADLGNHRGSNCSNPGQWGGVVHVWSSHAILTCCWWLHRKNACVWCEATGMMRFGGTCIQFLLTNRDLRRHTSSHLSATLYGFLFWMLKKKKVAKPCPSGWSHGP